MGRGPRLTPRNESPRTRAGSVPCSHASCHLFLQGSASSLGKRALPYLDKSVCDDPDCPTGQSRYAATVSDPCADVQLLRKTMAPKAFGALRPITIQQTSAEMCSTLLQFEATPSEELRSRDSEAATGRMVLDAGTIVQSLSS